MKKAIVIGATSGIGKEVALLLAEQGWQVGVAGRRIELLRTLQETSENITHIKQIDVTEENATTLLHSLISEMGGMDLYFHSSGIGWQNPTLDEEKERQTIMTNGVGFTQMVDSAFNYFASENKVGHIACISSIAGTKGLGAAPAYSATKRFQNHYLECLTQMARMRKLPISITDVRPGFVATDLISGGGYPMQLSAKDVARDIINAIDRKKGIAIIDWRYRVLVFLWRLIPRWLWIRLRITTR